MFVLPNNEGRVTGNVPVSSAAGGIIAKTSGFIIPERVELVGYSGKRLANVGDADRPRLEFLVFVDHSHGMFRA